MTTGVKSSFPIARLASKYLQMQRDGELLSNRSSLAIVRERIRQLADRIDLNEAPDRLAKLRKLWVEYTGHVDSQNHVEAVLTRDKLDEEFERAYHDYASWQQMFEALDLDRRMVESEVKIIERIKAIMTAEDAYELVAKVLASVVRVVDDPQKIMQVKYEFARLIGDVSDDTASRLEQDAWRGGGETIDPE